jgi:hypothetical protein
LGFLAGCDRPSLGTHLGSLRGAEEAPVVPVADRPFSLFLKLHQLMASSFSRIAFASYTAQTTMAAKIRAAQSAKVSLFI